MTLLPVSIQQWWRRQQQQYIWLSQWVLVVLSTFVRSMKFAMHKIGKRENAKTKIFNRNDKNAVVVYMLLCVYARVLSCRALSHGLKTRVQCTLMNTRTHNNRQIILDPYQRVCCCFKTCIGNPMNATIYVTSLPSGGERWRKKWQTKCDTLIAFVWFGSCVRVCLQWMRQSLVTVSLRCGAQNAMRICLYHLACIS